MTRRFIRTDRGYLVNSNETQFVRRLNAQGNGGTVGDNDPAPAEEFVYATDTDIDAVIAIAVDTGAVSIITDDNTSPGFTSPLIKSARTATSIYVVDGDTLYEVTLSDGTKTVISSDTVPDGTNNFDGGKSPLLDTPNNRVILVDGGTFQGDGRILSVSLTDGARTVFNDNNPGPGLDWQTPEGAIIDTTRDLVVALDATTQEIYTMPLSTGTRTSLADLSANGLYEVVHNLTTDQYIVGVTTGNTLITVDPDTGATGIFGSATGAMVAYNADTEEIYGGDFDGEIRRYNASTGAFIANLTDAADIGTLISLSF